MRKWIAVSLAVLGAAAHAQGAGEPPAHAYGASRPIAGQYIVVFKDRVTQPAALAAQLAQQNGGRVLFTYTSAIKGFAAQLPEAAVNALRNNPNVEYVEQDQAVSLNEAVISPPAVQSGATWGLDRIDERALTLNGSYRYEYTAAGVYAFIIDTGILSTHAEFGGRVVAGFDAVSGGSLASDCNGHGTHVAGTVGGSNYGVAKAVTLVPVRVLDCAGSGSYSGVIAGVDFVANSSLRPAVANMSLGGGKSTTVNSAVAGAVSKGVTMVVAAGNSNVSACNASPASEPTAITVGATTNTDARASYSNYGSCVDIFAPGSNITSAWHTGNTVLNTISGTSMASPHVAGVAALLAAGGVTNPEQVTSAIINQSTLGKVTSAGTGSPNRLLHSVASEASSALQVVAISALTGKGSKAGSTAWKATATVTVKAFTGSNWGNAVAGATVSGSFSPGGSTSCVTGSTGSCTLTSSSISRTLGTSTFAVSGVTGAGLSYDATKNAATSVVINRP